MSVRIAIYKRYFPNGITPVIEMTIPCSEDDVINAVRSNYQEFEIKDTLSGEKEITLPGDSVIWISSLQ